MPAYATGPGHHTRSRGAVVETYVDTDALEVRCPACHVAVGEFCVHENGASRRMPCPRRIALAAKETQKQETP